MLLALSCQKVAAASPGSPTCCWGIYQVVISGIVSSAVMFPVNVLFPKLFTAANT
jgi:hypothetical protein